MIKPEQFFLLSWFLLVGSCVHLRIRVIGHRLRLGLGLGLRLGLRLGLGSVSGFSLGLRLRLGFQIGISDWD